MRRWKSSEWKLRALSIIRLRKPAEGRSLMVTLGTWFVGLGLASYLFPGRQPAIQDSVFRELALGRALGLSYMFWIAIAIVIALLVMLRFTHFGRMIVAMGLSRREVYIANVLKCRPPGNRTPEPDEVAACTPFLLKQLGVVRPEVIVTLGRTATGFLLGSNAPMSRLRGQWHTYQGIPLLPTWHPSYLLRNPAAKKDVWEDMKLLLGEMGLPIPAG